MPTAQKALIQVELGATMVDFAAMTDSGDHQRLSISGGLVWSSKSGSDPDIRPNGIVDGLRVLSPHADVDKVTVAGFTAYESGTLYEVSAGSVTVTRPSTSTHKISSIVMDETGTLDEIEGTEGSSFSDTRGASGGPPLIPVDNVEIGQVRMSAQASAVFAAGDIFQDANIHAEYAAYPVPEVYPIGKGQYATVAVEKNAHIKLNAALPLSHTGGLPKAIYIKYYSPNFTTMTKTVDFSPSEVSVSKSSESLYEGSGVAGAIGSMKADSVGDCSFVVFAENGVTDGIVRERNEIITVKFFPDASKAPYLLTQGMLGIARQFPAGGQNKIDATLYCEQPSVEFAS